MKKNKSVPVSSMSRRVFLRHQATLLGGALVAGPVIAAEHACRVTVAEMMGPFYRFGAPFKAQLAGPDEPGQRLILSGTVYGADCKTPLPGALLDFWQANDAGQYDTTTPGNFTEKHDFHLRGMLYTDEDGRYEIETVIPGRYPVPPGLPGLEQYAGLTRPAHIHVSVKHPLHMSLTTQLYFAGDPYLADDPWGGHKPSLAMNVEAAGDVNRGTFDFVLGDGL